MVGRYNRATNCMDYGYWETNTRFRVIVSVPCDGPLQFIAA